MCFVIHICINNIVGSVYLIVGTLWLKNQPCIILIRTSKILARIRITQSLLQNRFLGPSPKIRILLTLIVNTSNKLTGDVADLPAIL